MFQDDEIEDVVGEVKLTESQKSVTISNIYSMDFTDSSSDKQNSSGMDTYVIECDGEDSESSALQVGNSIASLKDKPIKPDLINRDSQCETAQKINRATSSIINECSIFAQEIFTQTSKTIIELAEIDGAVRRPVEGNTLDTQTSFISITENRTIEYRLEVSESTQNFTKNERIGYCRENTNEISCHQIFPNSIDDGSSKFMISDTENDKFECTSDNSSTTNAKTTSSMKADSKDNILLCEDQNEYENISDFDQSADITDIEEDSLMEPKLKAKKTENQSDGTRTPLSVDDDVAELYSKLSESIECRVYTPSEHERKRFGYLTPLTEESLARKVSTADVVVDTPVIDTSQKEETDKDVLFTNNAGIKIKVFPQLDNNHETEFFKLPPIQSTANNGPDNLNFLFNITHNKLGTKASNLPWVYEVRKERNLDGWEMGGKNLAAGESALISGRSGKFKVGYNLVSIKK